MTLLVQTNTEYSPPKKKSIQFTSNLELWYDTWNPFHTHSFSPHFRFDWKSFFIFSVFTSSFDLNIDSNCLVTWPFRRKHFIIIIFSQFFHFHCRKTKR